MKTRRSFLRELLTDGEGGSVLPRAAPILVGHLALLAIFDLGRTPGWTLLVLSLTFVAWAFAARRLENVQVPTISLLLIAGALRLTLLPLPPTMSDDTLRYVWDGRVLAAGFNPYSIPPESEELAPLRDELWSQMPHQHVPTVYPPLALAAFTVASQLPAPLIGIKILLSLADLVGCLLLIALARRLGKPSGKTLWYCWNPLVVLEVAGMGHVDALMVVFMIAAVLCLIAGRPAAAAAAAAGAVLAKLIPFVLVPLWARSSQRPWLFLAVTAALIIVGILPVALTTGVPPGLVAYGVSWEFNGPIYEPLWRLVERAEVVAPIKSLLDRLKNGLGYHDFWNRLYPLVYPQFLAKLILAAGFGATFLVQLWKRQHPVVATGRLCGVLVLSMATFYPWYLLWMLPWAALAGQRSWLVLSALLPLCYLPQKVSGFELFPGFWALIWIPFFVLLALDPKWSID